MFKTLTVYSLTVPAIDLITVLPAALATKPFVHCLPTFPMSHGWVPALPESEEMVFTSDRAALFCLRTDTKTVPASAVRERVEEARRNAEREGELLTPHDVMVLTEQITEGFLPGIPPATKLTYAYIDARLGLLFLGATGAVADEFMGVLKLSLKAPVPAALLSIALDPCRYYTRWAMEPDCGLTGDFKIGTTWSLKSLDDDGGVINLKNEPVDSPEMRALIEDGRHVCSITLCSEAIDFRLTSTLGLRSIVLKNINKGDTLDEDFVYFVQVLRAAMSDLEPLLGGWVKQELMDLRTMLEIVNVNITIN